ncbi:uncharacterized protein [Nicotiana sylvestris]|uniref:uncharacterized protein n=1 Tax=Nicotiana sylvestris TaxID=4096 RepID=UPI00388CE276
MVEGLVNKLSMKNGKPYVVAEKRSPSDVIAKQEKSKVVVPGTKVIPWNYERVIVTYKGKEVKEEVNEAQGLTLSGRCFAPEELRKAKTSRDNQVLIKKAVTKEEAKKFLRKMKVQDYSIVEQLRKTPAQIFLLSLLIHSDEHLRALMKMMNEVHVPNKISVNHLEKIANKIFEVNRVTFSDDELHVEGRSWIHAAKVVPSTLHQMVKFEWDSQEIIVHGKDNSCAHSDASVPFIEVEDEKGPWFYQVFETVPVEKVLEGKSVPTPKIASTSVMVDSEMLKNGFVPGKGLGASLQGIIQPVSLPENLGTYGLGFKPTTADVRRARKLKQRVWVLPKPIPRLSRSFVKPGVRKRPVTTVPSSVVDIDEELIERFQRLFDDVNMVEFGEGSSKANMQFVELNVKLNNWKATPLPTHKESCSFYAGFSDMTCMRNLRPSLKSQSNSEVIIQEIDCDDELEYDEEEAFEEISKELNHFEEKPKPNMNDTEAINLEDPDNVRKTKIIVHLEPQIIEEIIKALFEYNDIFAWSYDDIPGLSTDLVVYKLPINPAFPPVKQKLRKFKTDMSVKIKFTKQLNAKVIRVTRYPTWLANVVSVPNKDDKTRVCVDYRDLNKASPKDNFPLPNIHILIDNCAKH